MTDAARAECGDIESSKRTLRRRIRGHMPPEPESACDIQIEGEWATTGGANPRPFLIHDSGASAEHRMLVFATEFFSFFWS